MMHLRLERRSTTPAWFNLALVRAWLRRVQPALLRVGAACRRSSVNPSQCRR